MATVTGGETYDLLPAGDAISVPDSLCESRFVKALIQAGEVLVSEDEATEGDDGEFNLDNSACFNRVQ